MAAESGTGSVRNRAAASAGSWVTAAELAAADAGYRKAENNFVFLRERDARVLGGIGLTQGDQAALHNAWLRPPRQAAKDTAGCGAEYPVN